MKPCRSDLLQTYPASGKTRDQRRNQYGNEEVIFREWTGRGKVRRRRRMEYPTLAIVESCFFSLNYTPYSVVFVEHPVMACQETWFRRA